MTRSETAGAIIHLAAWILTFLFIRFVFGHSDSQIAYSLLSGWWAALYLGFVFAVGIKSFWPSIAAYALIACADKYFRWQLFHDMTWLLLVFGFVVYVSPILINAGMRRARRATP